MYLRHCKNYNGNSELSFEHVAILNLSKSEILYFK